MEAQKEDKEITNLTKNKEENIQIINGLICGKIQNDWKIIIPAGLKNTIIKEFHEDPLQGAHLGLQRTLEKIKRTMFWKGMTRDITDKIRVCEVCQRRKIVGKHLSREEIYPIEPASRPFDRINIDLLGPIQKSLRGHQYIFVAVDSFSKWAMAVPIRNQTASTIADIFFKEIVCRFGIPSLIITDQGTQFMSSTFQDLAKSLNFRHQPTTPYHQSANGLVERFNRTLADMIATCTDQGKNWVDMLPHVIFAYNTSYNHQIGNSPFFVVHGFLPKLPTEAALGIEREKYKEMNSYVQKMLERITIVREDVKSKLLENVDIMKHQQNKINKIMWEKGDKILVKKMENLRKFGDKWEGPYEIIEIQSPNLLISETGMLENAWLIHSDKCKRFYSEEEKNKGNQKMILDPNIEISDDEEGVFRESPQINSIVAALDFTNELTQTNNNNKTENNNIQNQLQAFDMSKTSSIISISDYISDNETSIKEKLPWHMEDISSTELTEDEERLLPITCEEKEKRKEEKRRRKEEEKQLQRKEKEEEEGKQARILEAKRRGEEIGNKIIPKERGEKRKKGEEKEENDKGKEKEKKIKNGDEIVDWETARRLKKIRSRYDEDMKLKKCKNE
uniref:RNA-directed DNA polymerase n=1 Tax=Meloidogyne enterolobii TaxID=390850 RepID=A0A6V7XMD0_MELEN|nr:unnamed protein product [Meloidogyne enterolobii]